MKTKAVLKPLLKGTIHFSVWVLVVWALDSMLGLQSEEVFVYNGKQQTVIRTQSILPYLLVSITVKAVAVYASATWLIPRFFIIKRIRPGLFLASTGLLSLVGLEYLGYQYIHSNVDFKRLQSLQVIGENVVGFLPSENWVIQESPFAFWNVALYVLVFAVLAIWFLALRWQLQQDQLKEWQKSTAGAAMPAPADKNFENATRFKPEVDGADIPQPSTEFLLLKSGNQIHRVKTEDILFLKKEGNYFIVYTTNKKIVIRQNMGTAMQLLPSEYFRRIHRSYIVSLHHVTMIGKNHVQVGEHTIPVGHSFRALLQSHSTPATTGKQPVLGSPRY